MQTLKTFIAESKDGDVLFSHSFDAVTHDQAQAICDKNGWIFMGQIFDDAELEAMIEYRLTAPKIH